MKHQILTAISMLLIVAIVPMGCNSFGPTPEQSAAAASAHKEYINQTRDYEALRVRITPTDRVTEQRVTYADDAGNPQEAIDTGKLYLATRADGSQVETLIAKTADGLLLIPLDRVIAQNEVVTKEGECSFIIKGGSLDIATHAPLTPLAALGNDTTKAEAIRTAGEVAKFATMGYFGLEGAKILGDAVGGGSSVNTYNGDSALQTISP